MLLHLIAVNQVLRLCPAVHNTSSISLHLKVIEFSIQQCQDLKHVLHSTGMEPRFHHPIASIVGIKN